MLPHGEPGELGVGGRGLGGGGELRIGYCTVEMGWGDGDFGVDTACLITNVNLKIA